MKATICIFFVFVLKFHQISTFNDSSLMLNMSNTNSSINEVDGELSFKWPILFLFLFPLFGTIGNYFVCYAIIRDHSLQTRTNYYLFSLAISDLAVSLVVAPLAIINDFIG